MKRIIFSAALMALAAACGDDGGQQPTHDAASPIDASVDAPAATCFSGTPTTHEQIINACTNVEVIYKTKKPPLLNPDGSLPPLPP